MRACSLTIVPRERVTRLRRERRLEAPTALERAPVCGLTAIALEVLCAHNKAACKAN